jgi:hypothetical protein
LTVAYHQYYLCSSTFISILNKTTTIKRSFVFNNSILNKTATIKRSFVFDIWYSCKIAMPRNNNKRRKLRPISPRHDEPDISVLPQQSLSQENRPIQLYPVISSALVPDDNIGPDINLEPTDNERLIIRRNQARQSQRVSRQMINTLRNIARKKVFDVADVRGVGVQTDPALPNYARFQLDSMNCQCSLCHVYLWKEERTDGTNTIPYTAFVVQKEKLY